MPYLRLNLCAARAVLCAALPCCACCACCAAGVEEVHGGEQGDGGVHPGGLTGHQGTGAGHQVSRRLQQAAAAGGGAGGTGGGAAAGGSKCWLAGWPACVRMGAECGVGVGNAAGCWLLAEAAGGSTRGADSLAWPAAAARMLVSLPTAGTARSGPSSAWMLSTGGSCCGCTSRMWRALPAGLWTRSGGSCSA